MPSLPSQSPVLANRAELSERLQPRLEVERYFHRSGRTLRKGRFRLWFNRWVKPAIFKFVFRVLGIYARGVRNSTNIRVKRIVLPVRDLPPIFEGFRILQLSDFHIDGVDGLAEALQPVLRKLHADVCVFTGDYRFEITGPCDEVYPRMQKVISSINADHGTIAILGNHDAAEIAYRLEEMSVRFLVNEAVELRRGADSIWIVGLDDQFDYRCADLPLALSAVPDGSCVVLLAHDPQLYIDAQKHGVALYLCGHTHAGQIRLPLIGAVKKNAPVPRNLVQGPWEFEGMHGHTSWGVGCSTLPVRYNCDPEVAILELRRQLSGV